MGVDDLLKSDDATPLGVDVRAIVLIGARDTVGRRVDRAGVVAENVEGADVAALRARLAPFVGRPLSRKLIAEVQAAVAAVYRDAGRPFVSVTLPPQEVSTGVLQVRVIVFKVGSIKVTGAPPDSYLGHRIRVVPGEEIDARRLETDLDWANRNPFRQVEAVFGPGKDLGTTDLDIKVTERRPWQAFGGYSNSGTTLSDRNRYFVGLSAAPIGDVVASYQATGSGDFWFNNGRLFNDPDSAQYMSHAGRLTVPLAARTSLEVVADHVVTNERPVDAFLTTTKTSEASAIIRTALSDLLRPAFGDLLGGVELKHQHQTRYVDDFLLGQASAAVAQWVVGWNGRWPDAFGNNSLDIRVKSNPGGILPDNTGDAWDNFSNGRVSDVRMTFATVEYARVTPLPMSWSLKSELSVLAAARPLPDTERVGLGGMQGVRGYVIEDGVVDRAAILRNSLYLPPVAMPASLPGAISPFLLADIGWGRDIHWRHETTLSSVGAGLDYSAGANASFSLSAATALRDGQHSPAGSWRIFVRALVSY